MFSNKDLKNLILPLFLEQILTILVGLADTFVISFVGEAAVSGITLLFSVVWNTAVFAVTPVIMPFFDVAPETRKLTVWLVLIHNVFNCIAFPFADPLGKGLRAAGDVKFTVVWSLVTTIGVRLLASVLLAIRFDLGVIGIALAMSLDWCVRAVVFYIRFKRGKWKNYQLI